MQSNESEAPAFKPLPYATTEDLVAAFNRGVKFRMVGFRDGDASAMNIHDNGKLFVSWRGDDSGDYAAVVDADGVARSLNDVRLIAPMSRGVVWGA